MIAVEVDGLPVRLRAAHDLSFLAASAWRSAA